MNINEMIKRYSKNGVQHYKLNDIVEFLNGKGHEKNIVENGKYIVVNSKFISTDGETKKFSNEQICPLYKDDILMVMSDLPNGRALAKCFYVDEDNKYTLNQRICALKVKNRDLLNTKFLYYYLNRNRQLLRFDNGVDQTNLRKDDILNIKVAVPPLEVQDEIIHILDDFTELTAELTAELKARQQQYDYYKDSLFLELNDVKKYKLNEIAQIYDGTHQTPKYTDSGVSFISVENISDIYNSKKYISVEDYNKYKIKPKINDIFMTRIGSIGKCSVYDKEKDLAYYVSLALIRPNNEIVNSYYLKFLIESIIGIKELRKRTLVNAVPIKVNKDDIGKIELPIPNLKEQERIVNILNRFDKLCNDISEGLPAEIEARQKQYEYYRDKLLTFKELEVNEVQ